MHPNGTHTAMVLMPVKSVTVAEPPRISIELTMIFVARLFEEFNEMPFILEDQPTQRT